MNGVREPIIIAEAPAHFDVDQLSTGVVFELARIAQAKDIDLANVPRQVLSALPGSNVKGVKQICNILGIPEVPVMNEKVAEALDWEARCLVQDDGAMLEHDVSSDQGRRGGQVLFGASVSMIDIISTSKFPSQDPLSNLKLRIPRLNRSCLFTRVFGSHRFLRVSIQDRERYRYEAAANTLYAHALRPIKILGRTFRPLVEKEDTIWYYLEGVDRVGVTAEHAVRKRMGEYGMGRYINDTQKLVDWWIPLNANGKQLACKLVTRLHLGISSTWAGPLIRNIEVEEDITRGGYTFTDGAGMISEEFAYNLWRRSPIDYNLAPPAYQIRIGTAKGVVQVAPRRSLEQDGGQWMTITESMLKAKHGDRMIRDGPAGGMHILDAAHYITCVVKTSACRTPARLNAQIIPILCHQGVPMAVLQRLQADTITKCIESLWKPPNSFTSLQSDTRLRLSKAIQSHSHLIFKAIVTDPVYDGYVRTKFHPASTHSFDAFELDTIDRSMDISYANAMHDRHEQLYLAILSGFNVTSSEYFINTWKLLVEKAAKAAFAEFHINVDGSALVTIVPDFTEQLEEGFISFTPFEPVADSDGGIVSFTSGFVLVGRNPALLCTDIQKVQLADVPALRERRGVIFFSTKGKRPLADFLAGGDYDGDEVLLIWDQAIVEPFNNAVFDDEELIVQKTQNAFERENVTAATLQEILYITPEESREDVLAQHLLSSLKVPPLLGYYYNFYLKAVNHYGIASSQARLMAHKFNVIMDSPRTSWKLKPSAREEDERNYGPWSKPKWKHEQDAFRKGSNKENNGQNFPTTIRNTLDELFEHGERVYKQFYSDMAKDPLEFKADLAQRQRLRAPYEQAEAWVHDIPEQHIARKAELEMLKSAVRTIRDSFKVFTTTVGGRTGKTQAELVKLVRQFESEPPLSQLPLMSSLDPSVVLKVKASYAYYLDTEYFYAGERSGFPWRMACPTLLAIVAEHPITLPREAFIKLTPHHSFCKESDP